MLFVKSAAGWVVIVVVAQEQSKRNWWELCLTMGGSRCVSASMRRDEDGIQLGLDWQLWKTKTNRYYATRAEWQQRVCSGVISALLEARGLLKNKDLWTCGAEVEEVRQLSAVGESRVRLAQFIKEGVGAGLERGESGGWRVLQQAGAQGDGFWGGTGFEHLEIKQASARVQHKIALTDTGSDTGHRFINRFHARICFYQSGRVRSRRSNLTSGLSVWAQARVSGFLLPLLKSIKK